MTYYQFMIKVNIHEAKTHLSEYLTRIAEGERILLCKRNVPIAEIRPIHPKSKDFRPIGLAKNSIQIPDSFFEPLPEELLNLFNASTPIIRKK